MKLNSTTVPNLVAIGLALITVALLSAGPIADGDLWWQMAYGRYMLENGTLIPDHSVFSWTFASNDHIYCAWIAEIALYLVHAATGTTGLFALRYLAMLLPVVLLMWVGKQNTSQTPPMVWLAFLVCYLISFTGGGLLKPEIFSFMLFSLTTAIFFRIKSGEHADKLCYLFPLVMLVWVNTHGGFLVGCFFLAVMAIGEILNYLLRSPHALSAQTIKHLALAGILTIISVFCTPYGASYALDVLGYILGQNQQHLSNIAAYKNIFDPGVNKLFLPLYLYIAALLTLPLFIEQALRRKLDYSVLLLSILFIVFYIRYTRMTYFYAIIFVFSLQYLLARSPGWQSIATKHIKWMTVAAWVPILLMIGLSTHRIQDTVRHPAYYSSFANNNFGNSYINPVSEAKFISENFATHKLCNGYSGGGYLLWKLWPQQKVMIDPRYFPFASWYGEWANLSKNPTYELLSNYDCTVWAINFGYYSLVKTLRASPDWQLVFVGAAGAVFAKKSSLEEQWTTQTGEDLWHVSVPTRAMRSLSLLLDNKDLKLALQLAEKMKQNFQDTRSESQIEKAYAYAHGLVAYYKRDYAAAYKLVKKSQAQPTAINNKRLLVRANLFLTADLWDNGRYKEAQKTALEGVKLAPTELAALYNAGTLLLSVPNTDVGSSNWREHLEKFVSLGKQSSRVPAKFVNIAESALESGTLSLTKPLVPENRPAKLDPLTLY